MIGKPLRVAFPDIHGMLHQLAHGWLEIVVAHHAAGDAGRTRSNAGLIDDDDAPLGALTLFRKPLAKTPCG